MIRWQHRQQSYHVSETATAANETNSTRNACIVPFVYARTSNDIHYTRSDDDRMSSALKSTQTGCGLGLPRGQGLRFPASVPRAPGQMPLLFVSMHAQQAVRTSAVGEAAKTGLVNASAGAVLGACAWAFGGPPGGALFYAITGASAVGIGTAGCQAASVALSNWDRRFAERCNQLLAAAHSDGMSLAVAKDLAEAFASADSDHQRALVSEIAATALLICGNDLEEECRRILVFLAPEVAPERFGGPETQARRQRDDFQRDAERDEAAYQAYLHALTLEPFPRLRRKSL